MSEEKRRKTKKSALNASDNKGNNPVENQEVRKDNSDFIEIEEDPEIGSKADMLKVSDSDNMAELKKKRQVLRYKIIRTVFTASLLIFSALFINEVIIQPYRSKRAIESIDKLYKSPQEEPVLNSITGSDVSLSPTVTPAVSSTPEPEKVVKDLNRDDQGRLLQFRDLLAVNDDVKGWISIPDSNVNYVVVQPKEGEDPEYYLRRNLFGETDKAGTLFLDKNTSLEDKTRKNMVIHGHNMYTRDNMFHYVTKYKELDFYKQRPVFTFDTIYNTGKWKIFSVFITNGTTAKEDIFDYTRTSFTDSSDFLNFVYQLRIRSMYFIDDVDINENDTLLTLSTCSYEVKDYRTVVVARKVREGEASYVNVTDVAVNPEPLLPYSYYYRYGGKAPKLPETFEEALEEGKISWYQPVTDNQSEPDSK